MRHYIGGKHKLALDTVAYLWYTNGIENITADEAASRKDEKFEKKTMSQMEEASKLAKTLCGKHNIEHVTFVYTEVTKEGTTLPVNCWELAILEGREINSPDIVRDYAELKFNKLGKKASDVKLL